MMSTLDRRERILILGAAGRDFHNFNVCMRSNKKVEVVGFTATQIPGIEGRKYPPELSGPLYPDGLPIWHEDELEKIVEEHKVDKCILSYSDLPYAAVMRIGSRVQAAKADFELLCPRRTFIESKKPVLAICAVRTGCGKSQMSRYAINVLKKHNLKTVLIRHPMPYGDLKTQISERFAEYKDLEKNHVTIEEREEYEQHIEKGTVVYAGVDYEEILRQAEEEADVIIWDGGNNDTPFYRPDLWITVADPHRAGAEVSYWPGDVNFRACDAIVINKANTAPEGKVQEVKNSAEEVNPQAKVFVTDSVITVDRPELIKGKRVLLVEDGPTLTHGEMRYGAGKFAAEKCGAKEIVDPRPFLKGSLGRLSNKYRHLGKVLPAMGYSPEQVTELEDTIRAVPCDAVVIATPMDLRKVIKIDKPAAVVRYEVADHGEPKFSDLIDKWVAKVVRGGKRFEPGLFKAEE